MKYRQVAEPELDHAEPPYSYGAGAGQGIRKCHKFKFKNRTKQIIVSGKVLFLMNLKGKSRLLNEYSVQWAFWICTGEQ
jgi:hypothetical protein